MSAGLSDAIAYLQQANESGHSLYDHLSDVLLKILEQRPARALDSFEALSFDLKQAKAALPSSGDLVVPEAIVEGLELLHEKEETNAVTNEGDMPDIQEQLDALEWGGVAVGPREETYRLILSIRRLLESEPLQSVRLWGKVLGREADYYVVESLYKEGAEEQANAAAATKGAVAQDSDIDDDEVAKRAAKAAAEAERAASETPAEKNGTGANKYTYWVCHHAGEAWTKLPAVSPAQIKAARACRKILTGRLDAAVLTHPAFPGSEVNLLRAQIARIAAAATVSPRGYYVADEEAEAEEEEAEATSVLESEEYAGLTADVLLDPRNWVHHVQALRQQGRCSAWMAPRAHKEDDDETEQDETDEEREDRAAAEAPQNPEELEATPKLLTAAAEDEPLGGKPAWTTKQASRVARATPVFALSNRWPGAVAVAYASGTKFANIYVGHALKYADAPYTPAMPRPAEVDTGVAQQLAEQTDPTVADEKEVERLRAEEQQKIKDAEDAAKKAQEEAAAAAAAAAAASDAGVTDTDAQGTEEEEEEEDETETDAK